MSELKDMEALNKRIKEKAVKVFEERQQEAFTAINVASSKLFCGYIGGSTATRDAFVKESKERRDEAIAHIEKELSNELLEKMAQLKYFFGDNQ